MRRAPVPLSSASAVGFGTYRVAAGVNEHGAALVNALKAGCTLIDTAASYAEGRSEQLVGDVLEALPDRSAFVITKLGYVTPVLERDLADAGIKADEFDRISAEARYSLSPAVLSALWNGSRRRLRLPTVDAALLHNPELSLHSNGPSSDFYERVETAFAFFETLVAKGQLRSYGVSCNALTTADHSGRAVSINRLLRAAERVSAAHHFRIVQFPFNFLERDAAVGSAETPSVLEFCRAAGLSTIGNRPLNAMTTSGPCRLATYDDDRASRDRMNDAAVREAAIGLVQERLTAIESTERALDFPVMQFVRDNWTGIDHPDTVDLIVARQVQPFVTALWGGEPPPEVRRVFGALHLIARQCARARLDDQARVTRTALVNEGVIAADDKRPLATLACEFALRSGLDHVLVGMRSTAYVADMLPLLVRSNLEPRLRRNPIMSGPDVALVSGRE